MNSLFLIPLFLLLLSCKEPAVNFIDFNIGAHNTNYNSYKKVTPPTYSYRYTSIGAMYIDYRVYVSDNFVDSICVIEEVEHVDNPYQGQRQKLLIDSLFTYISNTFHENDAIEIENRSFYITEIQCTYDSLYHYPLSYDSQFYQAPGMCVDGNFSFTVSEFVILEE